MFWTSKNAPISAFKNVFIIIYLDLQLFYWLLCYIAFSCCCPICKFNYVDNYSACRFSFTNKQTKKCRTMISPSPDPRGQRRTSPESCFLISLECLEAAAHTWGTQRRWAAAVTTQEMTSPECTLRGWIGPRRSWNQTPNNTWNQKKRPWRKIRDKFKNIKRFSQLRFQV